MNFNNKKMLIIQDHDQAIFFEQQQTYAITEIELVYPLIDILTQEANFEHFLCYDKIWSSY